MSKKLKVGDKVRVRPDLLKIWDDPDILYTIDKVLIDNVAMDGTEYPYNISALHINLREDDVIREEIWESPLYKIMSEVDD